MCQNLEELKKSAERLNQMMSQQSISIWGCGRIFAAFVNARLNTNLIHCLIDSHIPLDVTSYNVHRPEKNLLSRLDSVVIMSREYQDEIKEQCLNFYGCKAVGWDEV